MGLAARVALQLWIVAFIVFFGAEIIHLEPMLRVVTQLLFGVPLAAWALLRLRGVESVLDGVIGLALAAFVLVSLFSRDLVGSLETGGLVLAYAVLWRALRWVAARPDWRETVALGAATGLAVTLAFNAWLLANEKLALFRAIGVIPPLEGFQVFPWETVNVMPILVLLAIPFLAWSPPGPIRRVLLAVVVLAAVVVVPISVGRAGYLAIATAVAAYLVLRPGARLPLAGWPRSARLGLAVGAVALVAVVGIVGAGSVLRSLGESGRLLLWDQSAAMVADRPLLGNGPGTYSWARLLFGPDEARLIAVRLTHDVPLQTAIDGGLVLVVAFAAVLGTWLRLLVRSWTDVGRAGRLGVAVLAGVAVAGLLDDFSFLPAVTTLVIGVAAFSLPAPPPRADGGAAGAAGLTAGRAGLTAGRAGLARWAPLLAAAVMAAVTLPAVVAGSLARSEALSGRTAALDGNWSAAVPHYERATAVRGGLALYWTELGQARAALGDVTGARAAYETARQRNPGDPRPVAGLAELTEDPAERIALLGQAADLTISDPQYAYRLGLALAEAGDVDTAASVWGRAVALLPQLVGVLPYEDTGVERLRVAAAALGWLEQHPRPASILNAEARWDIGLYARAVATDAGTAWLAVDAARNGSPETARALAEQAIDENPYDPRGYAALAAAAAYACDLEAEEEALRLERLTGGAYAPRPDPVAIRREFVYRETSIGALQPPGTALHPDPGPWPWSLIGPPPECPASASAP